MKLCTIYQTMTLETQMAVKENDHFKFLNTVFYKPTTFLLTQMSWQISNVF